MELDELPSKVVFVGGGYISFEFAHVAARAGANVTILHQGTRPLNNFDPYLVDMLVQRTHRIYSLQDYCIFQPYVNAV
jgi:glutathione reductase (NADPH)